MAEIAGEIGVGKVILVVGAGRQQGDAGIAATAMGGEGRLQVLEEARDAGRVTLFEKIAGDVGVNHAIGQCEADAGQGLGVAVDNAPLAVGTAGEIGRVELQAAGAGQDAFAEAQEGAVGKHQLGRHEAFAHQLLLAVHVGEEGIEQTGPLNQCDGQRAPLFRRDDQWRQIELPALRRLVRVGEDVVGDAGVADPAVETLGAIGAPSGAPTGGAAGGSTAATTGTLRILKSPTPRSLADVGRQ